MPSNYTHLDFLFTEVMPIVVLTEMRKRSFRLANNYIIFVLLSEDKKNLTSFKIFLTKTQKNSSNRRDDLLIQ